MGRESNSTKLDRFIYPDSDPDGYEAQTPEDAALVSKLENYFSEAKDWRENQEKRWEHAEKLRDNKIEMKKAKTRSDLRFNLPLSYIYTILPIIEDFMPVTDIMPENSNDVAFSDVVQLRADQLRRVSDFDYYKMQTAENALTYGDGLMEVLPELDGNENLKRLKTKVCDIRTWYPAPYFKGMDIRKGEARYHILAQPLHVDEILSTYGVTIPAEGIMDENRAFVETENLNDSTVDSQYCLLKRCYHMEVSEDGETKLMYSVWANAIKIKHEEYEFYHIPYFKMDVYGNANRSFGIGIPALVSSSTFAVNWGMSNIFDNLQEFGNPIRRVTTSIWANFLTRFVGKRRSVEVNHPEDITYLQPTSASDSHFAAIEMALRLSDTTTGIHDVTAGKTPTSIKSGRAIKALQEASQSRIRYFINHNIGKFVIETGRYILELIQAYDTEPIILQTEAIGGDKEFVPYDPREKEIVMDNGEIYKVPSLQDTRFDIRLELGSGSIKGREATKEEAFAKFEAGIYGIEEYTNYANEPNKRELIESWYERQGVTQAMNTLERLREISASLSTKQPEEARKSKEYQELMMIIEDLGMQKIQQGE